MNNPDKKKKKKVRNGLSAGESERSHGKEKKGNINKSLSRTTSIPVSLHDPSMELGHNKINNPQSSKVFCFVFFP